MADVSTGLEPTTDSKTEQAGTDSSAAAADKQEKKSEIDAAFEAAKNDPAKLAALIESLKTDLSKTRKEAGDYRTGKKDLEKRLADYEAKETERRRAELSELERVKLEKADLEKKYAEVESRASLAEAKSAFTAAGATDVDSVLLYWGALSADEKAKTTPEKFATDLKAKKTHLFAPAAPTGGKPPNPRRDQVDKDATETAINIRPKTVADRKVLKDAWKQV